VKAYNAIRDILSSKIKENLLGCIHAQPFFIQWTLISRHS